MANKQFKVELIIGAVNNASAKLRKVGMAMTAVGATTLAAMGKAVQAAAQQETAENALESALRSHGDTVEALMPKFRSLASAIQDQTIIGDEATLSMMAQIRNLGVMPDKMEKAAKGAIGLQKALNLDSAAAARYTALAMQGETTILQRYVPALRTATTEAEKQAIVTDLMRKGYEQAQAESETMAGQLKQLKNSFGDLTEQVGLVLIPYLKGFIERAKNAISSIRDWKEENEELFNKIVKVVTVSGALMAALGPILIALPLIVSSFGALAAILPTVAAGAAAVGVAMTSFNPILAGAAVVVVALTTAIIKLNKAWVEANEAAGLALEKQKEVNNIAVAGVNIWKKYGAESVSALEKQNVSITEAKDGMQGMFAMAATLHGQDKERWLERAEIYKEHYTDLASTHSDTEQMQTDQTVVSAEERMAAIQQEFSQKMELENFDLQNFIKINEIKNKDFIKSLTEQSKHFNKCEDDKIVKVSATNKALAKLGIQRAESFKGTLSFMASAADSKNKHLAAMGKASAIAQATINTYEAATKALAQGGIFGAVLMGGVIAAGLAQVAKIADVTLEKGGTVLQTGMAVVHEGEVFSGANNEMGFGARRPITINVSAGTVVGSEGMNELAEIIGEKVFDDIKLESNFV